jgi:hypothetical protein
LSEKKTPEQPASQNQAVPQISQIFGLIKLLSGESEAAYRAGLAGTINELSAYAHLQIHLAEKTFQSLWWMCRYEVQKQATIVNSMVKLSSQYNTTETTKHNLTVKLQAHMWDAKMSLPLPSKRASRLRV